jgi:hypothetical protein
MLPACVTFFTFSNVKFILDFSQDTVVSARISKGAGTPPRRAHFQLGKAREIRGVRGSSGAG